MLTNGFDILNQVPSGVVFQVCVGGGLSRAALIEQNDAIDGGIEELTVPGIATAS
jgi:hypothetical protein